MTILYHISISLYLFASGIMGIFSRKAALFYAGRKSLLSHIEDEMGYSQDSDRETVWFHCASVGEFEQARPIIELLRERFPLYRIVITFFSPSGYELRKDYPLADHIFYLPMDTRKNAAKFIEFINPTLVIFIKYEFWRNYLTTLNKCGIPVYLVSGIFRQGQPFFRWWGGSFRNILNLFTHLFVQDENSASLLRGIGVERVTVCGDTRFDRVHALAQKAVKISSVEIFCGSSLCCVAGSTWPADEELIVAHYRRYFHREKIAKRYSELRRGKFEQNIDSVRFAKFPELDNVISVSSSESKFKLIIVPHEVDEHQIKKLINLLRDIPYVRYSELEGSHRGEKLSEASVLIIDSVGILSRIYRYGTFAYIGGGFGAGIHNILEAATYGMPVVFGPKFGKFKEARDLTELGGAFPVKSEDELVEIFDKLLADSAFRDECSQVCAGYVAKNIGATEFIVNSIAPAK
ncbi:MAG TPA: 3-deoxy-D-manno-octulosonic acid transferase [Rikenellaceae bacterium]|nr:3-deoxy-D-manno-octulosonic acid transferase [Rikenellaceae bacterium]